MQRNYEGMFIVVDDIPQTEQKEVFEKILKGIESLGGEVKSQKIWDPKRKFTYTIQSRGAQRKKYNQGCYWLVDFLFSSAKLSELKEIIRLEERILRHIIVNKGE